MTNVKRTFFITATEREKLCKDNNDPYIVDELPHFELDDGRTLYAHVGYGEHTDTVYTEITDYDKANVFTDFSD